jgi:phasin family protein
MEQHGGEKNALYRPCADGVSSPGEAPGGYVLGQAGEPSVSPDASRVPYVRIWKTPIKREEIIMTMTNPFFDMFRKFGSDLQVPQFDLDKMIEAHRRNIEALTSSATAMAEGAQAMAQKQREVFEASLREAAALVQEIRSHGDQNLVRQTEFAKKAFDIAVRGAQDTVQLTRLSTGDAVKILQDRMREGLEEIRGQGDAKPR